MQVIPALDLMNGCCVRLTAGDFATATTYSADPVAVARQFAAAGLTHLHMVDLDGARQRRPQHLHLLREIVAATALRVDYSGGLSTREAVEAAFDAGAAQVVIGSLAVREPATVRGWLDDFGPERLIIGADFRDDLIMIHGWQQASVLRLDEFVAQWLAAGATTFLCTDVRRDGALLGPATERYTALVQAFPQAKILASGGVGSSADLTALRTTGVAGTIVGKAFYEGRISLESLSARPSAPAAIAAASSGISPSGLARRIIPCLDVRAGRTVKGIQFGQLRDAGDPVEQARRYAAEGADELVFLDITATHERRSTLLELVRAVAAELDIPFTVGGGVAAVADAAVLLRAGADKVAVNSAALARPALLTELAEAFGAQCVVLAIDARQEADGTWQVYTRAGTVPTGREPVAWAQEGVALGAGEILLTSMTHDGGRQGFANELTRAVSAAVPVPVIASGGAGEAADFRDVLTLGRADAALAASVFHFGHLRLPDLKAYLLAEGIPVRP